MKFKQGLANKHEKISAKFGFYEYCIEHLLLTTICKHHYVHEMGNKTLRIALTKVAGAFRKPKGMRFHVHTPCCVTKAHFQRSSGRTNNCQNPDFASQIDMNLACATSYTHSDDSFIGVESAVVYLFKCL